MREDGEPVNLVVKYLLNTAYIQPLIDCIDETLKQYTMCDYIYILLNNIRHELKQPIKEPPVVPDQRDVVPVHMPLTRKDAQSLEEQLYAYTHSAKLRGEDDMLLYTFMKNAQDTLRQTWGIS